MRRPVSCDHERAPSAQGHEEVLDAVDVDKGRRALPLQYAPVLGVNPWVETQDVAKHALLFMCTWFVHLHSSACPLFCLPILTILPLKLLQHK